MRNVRLVIQHEIWSMIGRPSFWVTTFLLPGIIMLFSLGSQAIGMRSVAEEEQAFTAPTADGVAQVAIGYVDLAGLIHDLPESLPPGLLRPYSTIAAAQAALDSGEIRQYCIIAADYVASGELQIVDPVASPISNLFAQGMLQMLLRHNLLGGDEALAQRINTPIAAVNEIALEQRPDDRPAPTEYSERFTLGYGVLFLLFFVIMMSSTFMLRSVSREKENRVAEVLLLSVSPRDLMLGKVLGLSVVAFLQMAIWGGGSLLSVQSPNSPLLQMGLLATRLEFPPDFVVWAGAYFILGYLLYASMLGAVGALAPSARETGPFTFLVLLPLMIPLWLNSAFVEAPHGMLATALSLFPLTAPASMPSRLATGGVPLWQLAVSLGGLALTTYLAISIAARFFRADTLLSATTLDWRRMGAEWRQALTRKKSL